MKKYEIVVHNVGGKYFKEVYSRDIKGNLTHVSDEEANRIQNDYQEKEIFELIHSPNYEKVKSPFIGADGKNIFLYGRYINISSRISDEKNRF